MSKLQQTPFYERHHRLGAEMVDFGGWDMPLNYKKGIVYEHLATRRKAGLFDVSHMGRFVIRGKNALSFLQHVLTNNAAALEPGESQYTIIANQQGGAIDDAYLYRFFSDQYLLVVNAANRQADWDHFNSELAAFDAVELTDETFNLAMLSLQGPNAKEILEKLIAKKELPEPKRNDLSIAAFDGVQVLIGRTGYTGEPLCFELFSQKEAALSIWDKLVEAGAVPAGLGARDTLRLEAGLPLYGHELGPDPADETGVHIPIFASGLAKFAASFSPLKGNFIGRAALLKQFGAYQKIVARNFEAMADLPRMIMPVAISGKGLARQGHRIWHQNRLVGHVTSGTMVPCWQYDGVGIDSVLSDTKSRRAICLALIDSHLYPGDALEIEIRKKRVSGVVVPYHLRSEAPPAARPIAWDQIRANRTMPASAPPETKIERLLSETIANSHWRRFECINLIPSEQTPSPMAKLLSVMDPAGRYAEHKPVAAFGEAEVFYYQGTEFIAQVEALLQAEISKFLGCRQAEVRPTSGQLANTAVFSALVDFRNRADRKNEQGRIASVMNHHIIKGGHLSAQPMGALRDFVARNPQTEKPALVNFPVLVENPYQIDVTACGELIERFKPELIIFGKSMTLHKEPVAAIAAMVAQQKLDCVIMYDMAHVLGLAGPYFQEPFAEGADIVTASTHKTFFGTQRGIIAADMDEESPDFELWQAVMRRSFPGSVSNHHLGTLIGLLMAAYEMNHFKKAYQKNVLANAKTLAKALKECGLDVAGDASLNFTETHQVIVEVGYAKGPAVAKRLEQNNIIVNYQATPHEEGFTAAGALRLGVAEMTRFGMGPTDFKALAQLMADVILKDMDVKAEIKALRKKFDEIQYCFSGSEFDELINKLHHLI
jgi:aminomethyltransferase